MAGAMETGGQVRYERVTKVWFEKEDEPLGSMEILLDVHTIYSMSEGKHSQKRKKSGTPQGHYPEYEDWEGAPTESYYYCRLRRGDDPIRISAKDGRRIWDDLMIESHRLKDDAGIPGCAATSRQPD